MRTLFSQLLTLLLNRQDLTSSQMIALLHQMMAGELTSAQMSAILIALRMKGESVEEILGGVAVLRSLSSPVTLKNTPYLIDTCGTGGDGNHTFNISTASAFVTAGAGAYVAKHGGRSVSSSSGSADVLEALGAKLLEDPKETAYCIERIGIGFMFAPHYHQAMKSVAPIRKELGIRTLFNLLGPLANPAGAERQVIGVFSKDLGLKFAHVLNKLGSQHVLIVHGEDGMDEVSMTGNTYVTELKQGEIKEYILHPYQFNLPLHQLQEIQVNSVEESKQMLQDALSPASSAAKDIVMLNAGVTIYTAGITETIAQGIEKARQVIETNIAKEKLDAFIKLTQEIHSRRIVGEF